MPESQQFKVMESLRRWRYLKDQSAKYAVAIGGVGVIAALVLIFFYLLYIVLPLFESARIESLAKYPLPGGDSPSLYLSVEEQAELGMRVTGDGRMVFFKTRDGAVVSSEQLPLALVRHIEVPQPPVRLPAAAAANPLTGEPSAMAPRLRPQPPKQVEEVVQRQILQVAEMDAEKGLLALGLSDGSVLVVRHVYDITYPNDRKLVSPRLEYPYGNEALAFAGAPLAQLAARDSDDQLLLAGSTGNGEILLRTYDKKTSLIEETTTLTAAVEQRIVSPVRADFVQINPLQEWLYVADRDGQLAYYDVRSPDAPTLIQQLRVVAEGAKLQRVSFLAGGYSLVMAASDGVISQWFPVRDSENRYQLQHVRDFRGSEGGEGAALSELATEIRRRGFVSGDVSGRLGIYYSTSQRVLLHQDIAESAIRRLSVAPRANLLLAESENGSLQGFLLHNEHPEVSWSALWGKVWYEGYPEPERIWQSTAANNDFEPKLSLAPLAYGSLKGAFYAMLFAMPLAILGAIYTAYFMSPRLRQTVKPTIEVMQALPTVVLGFLAGLWLAPLVEANLPGIFGLLLLLPPVMILAGLAWSRLPGRLRLLVPEGWEAVLLIPVILVFGWLCFTLGRPLEIALFEGNLPHWLDHTLGISYDQRNCLVVGLAMGFAVIPTIFSIAEDAIFGVPKHLSNGSLALGATPWQTLVGVVLPTASPGIFSGVMIGLGRAVGETMIVLMATGNTPVMDFSMFSGMRTLSANVAVEMPESEVGSTHFRVLFLAGLVLFIFTFVLNTLAELVRQRLREKYSNI